MHPTLLKMGTLEFHSWTVFLSLGVVLGVILAVRENYRSAQPYPITTIGGLWCFFFALFGARAWFIVLYSDTPWAIYEAFYIWSGGVAFFGGLLGALLGGILYLKIIHAPILPVGDIVTPYVALTHAVIRVGCFFNGCCWGLPTALPWGVQYPRRSAGAYHQQLQDKLISGDAPFSLPAHPVQLYATIALVVLFFFLRHLYRRGLAKNRPGLIMFLYPLCYGIVRFGLEFVRGDNKRSLFGHFTKEQAWALAASACATAVLLFLHQRVWKNVQPAPEETSAGPPPQDAAP